MCLPPASARASTMGRMAYCADEQVAADPEHGVRCRVNVVRYDVCARAGGCRVSTGVSAVHGFYRGRLAVNVGRTGSALEIQERLDGRRGR